ncbi:hypothetical protein CDCA_CDCA01G0340 [Cyanidium caldarium]|uniref:Uncharacterized protein n=1 Tax=Cyanidium caldarium TaxID=2771 RepID=A0AAV9IQE3_CYACA|nr:hypothetical protein CDCA_CDCA01G0340 [Cyanidium caldarium]
MVTVDSARAPAEAVLQACAEWESQLRALRAGRGGAGKETGCGREEDGERSDGKQNLEAVCSDRGEQPASGTNKVAEQQPVEGMKAQLGGHDVSTNDLQPLLRQLREWVESGRHLHERAIADAEETRRVLDAVAEESAQVRAVIRQRLETSEGAASLLEHEQQLLRQEVRQLRAALAQMRLDAAEAIRVEQERAKREIQEKIAGRAEPVRENSGGDRRSTNVRRVDDGSAAPESATLAESAWKPAGAEGDAAGRGRHCRGAGNASDAWMREVAELRRDMQRLQRQVGSGIHQTPQGEIHPMAANVDAASQVPRADHHVGDGMDVSPWRAPSMDAFTAVDHEMKALVQYLRSPSAPHPLRNDVAEESACNLPHAPDSQTSSTEQRAQRTLCALAAEKLASLAGYARTLMARTGDSIVRTRLDAIVALLERYQQEARTSDWHWQATATDAIDVLQRRLHEVAEQLRQRHAER